MDESLREKDGLSLVKEFVDDSGGPYSRHLHSETEMDSFDSTCRKLYKFLTSLKDNQYKMGSAVDCLALRRHMSRLLTGY